MRNTKHFFPTRGNLTNENVKDNIKIKLKSDANRQHTFSPSVPTVESNTQPFSLEFTPSCESQTYQQQQQ